MSDAATAGAAEPDAVPPVAAGAIARWDDRVDVVVVGAGCAGAAAAIAARDAGADVLVLERAAAAGGTSAMSGGLIYLGGGTRVQRECGFDDSPDAMEAFLIAACGPGTDAAKVRAYCEHSVEHFEWLCGLGVPFRAAFCDEPGIEPDDDAGLVYSGGEDTWPFRDVARPAPRGHKPQWPAAAGGFLMQHLLANVERRGVRTVLDARVDALVVDDANAVVGVQATVDGVARTVRAGAVVLAAGGFVFNDAMVARHQPRLARCSVKIGTPNDDGAGIRLGAGVGGALRQMDAGECAIPITPPRSLVRGVLVNGRGERFMNEDAYYGRVGQEALFRQDGEVYLVLDDATYVVNRVGMKARWVAETVPELAHEMGLPAETLAATVARYNEHAAQGHDPDFHKDAAFLQPLEPPFGAIDLRVDRTIYATFTLGGLATDADGRVLDGAGGAVEGLLAAGRTTAGIAAHGYVSGISLGDGTFFGRRAGRRAAAHAHEPGHR